MLSTSSLVANRSLQDHASPVGVCLHSFAVLVCLKYFPPATQRAEARSERCLKFKLYSSVVKRGRGLLFSVIFLGQEIVNGAIAYPSPLRPRTQPFAVSATMTLSQLSNSL